MFDLLLELFSEEIPARMQRAAADDLRRLVSDGLSASGLSFSCTQIYWTPRRLVLDIRSLSPQSSGFRKERKGPRVDAPEKAIAGFVRSAGIKSIDEATVRHDPKRGDYYVSVVEQAGRPAEHIIAELLPEVIRKFPWPKSQRWGEGTLKWVRPLHSILCTLSTYGEEPKIVEFEVDGIKSSNKTYGHRFMAPDEISVGQIEDYLSSLEAAKVVLDAEHRKSMVVADAQSHAAKLGLEWVEDKELLEEVSGLVEFPITLTGEFERQYLTVPDEVVRLTLKENQKCFVLRDKAGTISNHFVLVSNIETPNGGKEVIRGNQRVVNARLSDAKFFWETDLRVPLPDQLPKLENVTFHTKIGSQSERVKRIVDLALKLSRVTYAEPKLVVRAAELAKADLNTAMVYEFPELQGKMGCLYALHGGEAPAVARAILDHYKPRGPSDHLPQNLIGVTVALADKLELLCSFWAIEEKPNGSKDPFALRRAAIGVIRLILENELRLPLLSFGVDRSLLEFFHDRLFVMLKTQGITGDVVKTVQSTEFVDDDLFMIFRRVEAVSRFIAAHSGQKFVRLLRRSRNMFLTANRNELGVSLNVDQNMLRSKAEINLWKSIQRTSYNVNKNLENDDFCSAIDSLGSLVEPMNAFFDGVLVNDDDTAIRENRLAILASLNDTADRIANFGTLKLP